MSMYEKKPLAIAVSLAMMSLAAQNALAQQAPAEADAATQVVEVTGIRASMAKSLNVKRNSSANVEVITAEDVGKMPDKNLADSLQRLAGVAVRTDYDEAEKVALRGTNPDTP
jgi:iron complex outermembrane receptor protein